MTFDYPGYELKFIQKNPCKDRSAHQFTSIYKFYSPVTRYFYILHADYHSQDFFAIKFYCKKDKRSKYKYSKIVNKGDVGNILITCLKAIPLLLQSYPTSSFGFIGARILDAASNKVESYINTQRFRVYKDIIAKKIGTKTFAHVEYEMVSGYLLINRLSGNFKDRENALVQMLSYTYEDLPDIS